MGSGNKNKHSSTKKNSSPKQTVPPKNPFAKFGSKTAAAARTAAAKNKTRKSPSPKQPQSPPKKRGSIVILLDENTNEILLGEEGSFYYEDTPTTFRAKRYIEHDKIDINNIKQRNDVTKALYDELKNPPNNYKDFLVPLVEKSETQVPKRKGAEIYGSIPRKRRAAGAAGGGAELGAPKGGKEGTESPAHTAYREIIEEVGITIGIGAFKDNGIVVKDKNREYTVFLFKVKKDKRKEIEDALRERYAAGIGEMFNLSFRDPKLHIVQLNDLTKQALIELGLIPKP